MAVGSAYTDQARVSVDPRASAGDADVAAMALTCPDKAIRAKYG